MKNYKKNTWFMGGLIISSVVFLSCSKNSDFAESPNYYEMENSEDSDYLLPFFEVAKGDSISKDVYRAKPIEVESNKDSAVFSTNQSAALRAVRSNSTLGSFIVDIQARSYNRSEDAPLSYADIDNDGWTQMYYKLNYDLNKGAGGKWIYFYYAANNSALSALQELCTYHARSRGRYQDACERLAPGRNWEAIGKYTGTDYYQTDLNEGAGGRYVYLYGTKRSPYYPSIRSIAVSNTDYLSGYYCSSGDLNDGAGGNYIYLFRDVNW